MNHGAKNKNKTMINVESMLRACLEQLVSFVLGIYRSI